MSLSHKYIYDSQAILNCFNQVIKYNLVLHIVHRKKPIRLTTDQSMTFASKLPNNLEVNTAPKKRMIKTVVLHRPMR